VYYVSTREESELYVYSRTECIMCVQENRVNYDCTVEESVLILHRKTDFMSAQENRENYIYRVEKILLYLHTRTECIIYT